VRCCRPHPGLRNFAPLETAWGAMEDTSTEVCDRHHVFNMPGLGTLAAYAFSALRQQNQFLRDRSKLPSMVSTATVSNATSISFTAPWRTCFDSLRSSRSGLDLLLQYFASKIMYWVGIIAMHSRTLHQP
jgi:hypothetical protein